MLQEFESIARKLHPIRVWRLFNGVSIATLAKLLSVNPTLLGRVERFEKRASADLLERWNSLKQKWR